DNYARRRHEDTVIYQCVAEHWPEFREDVADQSGLPMFVVADMLAAIIREQGDRRDAPSFGGMAMSTRGKRKGPRDTKNRPSPEQQNAMDAGFGNIVPSDNQGARFSLAAVEDGRT